MWSTQPAASASLWFLTSLLGSAGHLQLEYLSVDLHFMGFSLLHWRIQVPSTVQWQEQPGNPTPVVFLSLLWVPLPKTQWLEAAASSGRVVPWSVPHVSINTSTFRQGPLRLCHSSCSVETRGGICWTPVLKRNIRDVLIPAFSSDTFLAVLNIGLSWARLSCDDSSAVLSFLLSF